MAAPRAPRSTSGRPKVASSEATTMSAFPHEADPSPQAEAVHGGDDRHLAVVDGGEGGEAPPVDADQRLVPLGLDLLDVDPGAEAAALGPQDDHPVVGDPAGGEHGVGQGEPAGHVERVDRRVVDDHLGDSRLGSGGSRWAWLLRALDDREDGGRPAHARGRPDGLVERACSRRPNCNIAHATRARSARSRGSAPGVRGRGPGPAPSAASGTKRLVGLGRCDGGTSAPAGPNVVPDRPLPVYWRP